MRSKISVRNHIISGALKKEYKLSMQVSLEKGGFPKQDAVAACLHTTLLDLAVLRIQ